LQHMLIPLTAFSSRLVNLCARLNSTIHRVSPLNHAVPTSPAASSVPPSRLLGSATIRQHQEQTSTGQTACYEHDGQRDAQPAQLSRERRELGHAGREESRRGIQAEDIHNHPQEVRTESHKSPPPDPMTLLTRFVVLGSSMSLISPPSASPSPRSSSNRDPISTTGCTSTDRRHSRRSATLKTSWGECSAPCDSGIPRT